MKHLTPSELRASEALTLKDGGDDDPTDIVTKAVGDLTTTVNERLAEIEKKADNAKLIERMDKLEAKSNRAKGDDRETAEPSDERKAFAVYLRKGMGAPDVELKALNEATDNEGGFLAPEEISSEMIRDLVEYSAIRSVASVRSIVSRSIKYPKRTGLTNAQWIDELEDEPESTIPFGQVEITPHKLATFVDISNELLADSAGTAETEVRLALAEDFGQKEGVAFLAGSGIGQPEGILTNPDIPSRDAASGTAIDPDELIAMMYDLPAMYRTRGTWAMNGTTLAALRTLKDGDGRFLWQQSFQVGQPESILGRPVIELPDLPDLGVGTSPIVFGDFEGYRIVDRLAMSVLVNPYLLATKDATRIHAVRRVGGRVIQPARFRKLTMAAA